MSITEAAKSLFISQPAVTHQIKRLEEYCKFKLFKKDGHKICLTEEGDIIFQHALKLFEMERNIIQCVEDIHDQKIGCLHIGSIRVYTDCLISIILNKFHLMYKGVNIELTEGSSLEVYERLLNHKDSVGIMTKVIDDPNLCLIPLFREEVVLVSAPNYHLAKRKFVMLRELINEPIILKEIGSGIRKLIDDCFGNEKDKLDVIVEANNLDLIKEMVKLGDGISFLVKGAITKELIAGELSIIPIKNQKLFLNMYFAYMLNNPLSITAKLFIEFMRSFSFVANISPLPPPSMSRIAQRVSALVTP